MGSRRKRPGADPHIGPRSPLPPPQRPMKTELFLDSTLMTCVIEGTQNGLKMAGVSPPPIGASRFLGVCREVSVLVGLVGTDIGTMTLNLSERAMLYLAGALLMEVVRAE